MGACVKITTNHKVRPPKAPVILITIIRDGFYSVEITRSRRITQQLERPK
jgi:hypothetical protein